MIGTAQKLALISSAIVYSVPGGCGEAPVPTSDLQWSFAPAIGISSAATVSSGLEIGRIVRAPSVLPPWRIFAGVSLLSTGLGTVNAQSASGTFLLLQASFQPEPTSSGWIYGVAAGGALLTFSVPGSLVDRAFHLALGATGGYEFALGNGAGLGPELHALFHSAAPGSPALGALARLRLRF